MKSICRQGGASDLLVCLLCRKAKLQIVQEGQKICPKGLCFLFSGQLQTAGDFCKAGDASPGPALASSGTHEPSPDNSQAGGIKSHQQQVMHQETAMPLQGTAVGSVAHPNASGDVSDDTEHSCALRVGCILQAPAAFESDGTAATCLQHAKVGLSVVPVDASVRDRLCCQRQGLAATYRKTCCNNPSHIQAHDVVCSSM